MELVVYHLQPGRHILSFRVLHQYVSEDGTKSVLDQIESRDALVSSRVKCPSLTDKADSFMSIHAQVNNFPVPRNSSANFELVSGVISAHDSTVESCCLNSRMRASRPSSADAASAATVALVVVVFATRKEGGSLALPATDSLFFDLFPMISRRCRRRRRRRRPA
jgi:hypothetical protein